MAVRMRAMFRGVGWRPWLLAAMLVVALLAAAMFGLRTVRGTVYWASHRDEPIERWMPVNYVAHSYGVPPAVLWGALGLPDPRTERRHDLRPLSEIALARGESFEQVRATLQEAIATFRASPQLPPSPPPRNDRGVP